MFASSASQNPASPVLPRKSAYSKSEFAWRVTLIASAIILLLSIAAIATLMKTMGNNGYVYGVSAAGLAALILTIISIVKLTQFYRTDSSKKLHTISQAQFAMEHHKTQTINLNDFSLNEYAFNVSTFEIEDFKNWLRKKSTDNPSETVLLEATLLKHLEDLPPQAPLEVSYYQLAPNHLIFKNITIKQTCTHALEVQIKAAEYDYNQEEQTYINFTNGKNFGADWHSSDTAGQEYLFYQFFDLALFAYLKDKAGHTLVAMQKDGPSPFIIPSIKRTFAIDAILKDETQAGQIEQNIKALTDSKPIHIAAMAAKQWDGNSKNLYTLDDLIYHLQAAYLTFSATKKLNSGSIVYTGAWGCGHDNNSESMMIAIQLLAAKMADVEIVFTGVGNPKHPDYTEAKIREIQKLIPQIVKPSDVLVVLLQKQSQEPNKWAPKTSDKPIIS